MEASRRIDRIGSHISAADPLPRGACDTPDDIVIVDAIRTPITRAKKVQQVSHGAYRREWAGLGL